MKIANSKSKPKNHCDFTLLIAKPETFLLSAEELILCWQLIRSCDAPMGDAVLLDKIDHFFVVIVVDFQPGPDAVSALLHRELSHGVNSPFPISITELWSIQEGWY